MSIFINYRRSDTSGDAQALYGEIATSLGKDRVFMDVDNIRPGADFSDAIYKALGQCNVLRVLIGGYWLDADGTDAWTGRGGEALDLASADGAISRHVARF